MKRYTRDSFRRRCRLMNSDGMCEKYSGVIMPCDSCCGYMVDEWKYYNKCMDKQANTYLNALNYISDSKLSEMIYKLNIKLDNITYYWVMDRDGDMILKNKDDFYNYEIKIPAYRLSDIKDYVRDNYKVHIHMFIDGGWTYTIEDFGNNRVPDITEWSYDTYYEALNEACVKFFKSFNKECYEGTN